MQVILYIIVIICALAFIIVSAFLIYRVYRYKRAKERITNLFTAILQEHKSANNKLTILKHKAYDYYIETLTSIYYVKVLYNYNCYETSINSRYLWQYKVDARDDKIRFWPNVLDFVNLKAYDDKKNVIKLCLIYPNARSLLVYLNESEVAFVRPDQAIYGINFITFERLNSNHNYIEGR